MRKGARQSQIINNFFSLATIILVTIVLVLYINYVQKPQEKLEFACLKDSNTTHKISSLKLLTLSNKLISRGDYVLDGGIIQLLENSVIINKIKIFDSDNYFYSQLGEQSENISRRFVKIKYEFIENKKIFANLKVSFRINAKESFTVNTRLKSYNKKDIKRKIKCIVKAFKYYATRD